MELPKNGTVVIIDDEWGEAYPLMDALSRKGVSFCYYDGRPECYPEAPLSNIKLIFLDMHLDNVSSGANGSKNVISALMGGLSSLISPDNGPYAIMVWSKHDVQYLTEFKETVMGENGLDCKPIAILNMEKSSCFESIPTEDDKKHWKLKDGGIDIIEKNIEGQLSKVDSFSVLYNWEDSIRESARQTVMEFGRLFDTHNDEWNKNVKSFMVKMAHAYAGQTIVADNKDILKNIYYSLNSILNRRNNIVSDIFVNEVSNLEMSAFMEGIDGSVQMVQDYNGNKYVLSIYEGKFRFYKNNGFIQENKKIDKLCNHKIDASTTIDAILGSEYKRNVAKINSLLLLRNYMLDKVCPGNVYDISDDLKKEMCEVLDLSSHENRIEGIEVEISPICDYSQKKRKRLRFLPGILLPIDISWDINSQSTYITKPIYINGKIVRAVFDFRYFTSKAENYCDSQEAKWAIGEELLQNIKDNFFSHAVRSGMFFLE